MTRDSFAATRPGLLGAHFVVASLGWAGFALALLLLPSPALSHYYQSGFVAAVHLLTLLTFSAAVQGAAYQLFPVLAESELPFPRLAWAASVLWWTGAAGFIAGKILQGSVTLSTFALLAGALGYLFQIGWLVVHGRRGIPSVLTALSAAYLTIVAGIGTGAAAGFYFGFDSILDLVQWHAVAGMLGWFGIAIVAFGARLFPMFVLAHGVSEKTALAAGLLFALAPLFALPGFLFPEPWLLLLALAAGGGGYALFLFFVIQIVRRRMRKRIDPGIRLALAGFLFPLAAVAGVCASGSVDPARPLAPVLLFLLLVPGFVGCLIMGMSFKILPFMAWTFLRERIPAAERIPDAGELGARGLQQTLAWLYPASVLLLSLGALLPAAFVPAAGFYGFCIALYLMHNGVLVVRTARFWLQPGARRLPGERGSG